MILFPPAKINLGLRVTGKRTDGFHNLQTVFFQLPLCDVLEIVKDPFLDEGLCLFSSTGISIPGDVNLCVKAYQLLHNEFVLPGVHVFLHKIIPIGAGLGGGSSNATYTLIMLNQLFDLKISEDRLKELALDLGSDCPLFLTNKVQYAEGRGEFLSEIDVSLKGKYLLLVYPKIHISTALAYKNVCIKGATPFRKIIERNVSTWKNNLINDFEKSLFMKHPELFEIKEKLYVMGAKYAAMSGSGSTIYGIFDHPPSTIYDWPEHYFIWDAIL